jgi:hypothetical protein
MMAIEWTKGNGKDFAYFSNIYVEVLYLDGSVLISGEWFADFKGSSSKVRVWRDLGVELPTFTDLDGAKKFAAACVVKLAKDILVQVESTGAY